MTRVQKLAQAWYGLRRRAALFEYPIREMQARGWIETTNDTAEIEAELCRFFKSSTVEEIPFLPLSRLSCRVKEGE